MLRIRTRLATATLVASLALGSAFVVAAPAAAHDELISSDPAEGDQLAVAPETVTLTFSGEILPMGAAVVVADADGNDWVDGEPERRDNVVTVTLTPDMPEAGYEIRWRVVSEDGHPISGFVPFTIGDASPLEREAPSVAAEGTTDHTSDAYTSASGQSTQESAGAMRLVLIGAGGAALAVAAFALLSLIRRRGAGTGDAP